MKSHLEEKEIEAVEYLASLGYSKAEICENIECNDFMDLDPDSFDAFMHSYNKGKNTLKLETRISLKGLAVSGSHPALLKIISLLEKQEHDE